MLASRYFKLLGNITKICLKFGSNFGLSKWCAPLLTVHKPSFSSFLFCAHKLGRQNKDGICAWTAQFSVLVHGFVIGEKWKFHQRQKYHDITHRVFFC